MLISAGIASIIYSIIFAGLSQFTSEKTYVPKVENPGFDDISRPGIMLMWFVSFFMCIGNVIAMAIYYGILNNSTFNPIFVIGIVLSFVAIGLFDSMLYYAIQKTTARNVWLILLLVSVVATIVIFLIS